MCERVICGIQGDENVAVTTNRGRYVGERVATGIGGAVRDATLSVGIPPQQNERNKSRWRLAGPRACHRAGRAAGDDT